MNGIQQCPCCSEKLFIRCCARFLINKQSAKTPEQLMRSRYSAYALGGYGQYLLDTWHPSTAKDLNASTLSIKIHDWFKLEILTKSQKGDQANVEFKAYYFSEDGIVRTLHEKSFFQRISGCWLYVGASLET